MIRGSTFQQWSVREQGAGSSRRPIGMILGYRNISCVISSVRSLIQVRRFVAPSILCKKATLIFNDLAVLEESDLEEVRDDPDLSFEAWQLTS